jgi:phage protein D
MPFGHATVILDLIDAESGDYDLVRADMVRAVQDRMLAFIFSDHHRKKDQLKIVLRNDDYALLENPIFAKGQKIAATWGWPGQTAIPRRMVVTKVKGGDPITVTALDTTQLMDRQKISKNWENVTDSEVVREIAAEHGYNGQYLHVAETKDRHDVSQRYMTNARMLAWLARQNGFEFYVDASGMHWHERKLNVEPVRTFIYRTDPVRGDILDPPQFEVNLSRGVSRIKVVARDPLTSELWEAFGGPNDTEQEVLGLEEEMGDPEDQDQGLRASRLSRVDVRNLGILTEGETKTIADAMYRESVKGKYKMKLRVIGDGRVGAKSLIDVYGITESWNGLYYVRECEATVQGGTFVQNLKLEKSMLRSVPVAKKRKLGKKEKVNPVEATGEQKLEVGSLRRKRVLTTNASGDVVLANYWVDETGTAVGDIDYETSAFINQATDLEYLMSVGAQSVEPDAGR